MQRSKTSIITIRGVVFSALFAALMVVLSFVNIRLGVNPVPITLENLAPMLAGALLGPLYGFLSIFLVIFLTAIGLPLMHGDAGIAFIIGPTGGFIWMFPISALLTGLFVSRIRGTGPTASIMIFFAIWVSALTVYLVGVPWLAYRASFTFSEALAAGFTPFILIDTLKCVAATLIVLPIRRVFPMSRLIGAKDVQVADLRNVNH